MKMSRKDRDQVLSDKQRAFVQARAKGMNVTQAAQAAGYAQPEISGYHVEKSRFVKEALTKEFTKAEKVSEMSKKKVMDGFLHAIDQAKLLADPTSQISGWREIAKMCGYYEPQRLQVEVSVSAKRLFSQFETLSDDELLKIAEQEIIDVDSIVKEDPQSLGYEGNEAEDGQEAGEDGYFEEGAEPEAGYAQAKEDS
jgi:phage terminase small subunit